jgi:hypothetical protein
VSNRRSANNAILTVTDRRAQKEARSLLEFSNKRIEILATELVKFLKRQGDINEKLFTLKLAQAQGNEGTPQPVRTRYHGVENDLGEALNVPKISPIDWEFTNTTNTNDLSDWKSQFTSQPNPDATSLFAVPSSLQEQPRDQEVLALKKQIDVLQAENVRVKRLEIELHSLKQINHDLEARQSNLLANIATLEAKTASKAHETAPPSRAANGNEVREVKQPIY